MNSRSLPPPTRSTGVLASDELRGNFFCYDAAYVALAPRLNGL